MQNPLLAGAVEELQSQLAEQLAAAAETKKLINSLLKRMGLDPMYPDAEFSGAGGTTRIRSDQFYGKPLATAVQEFLEIRKRATGEQACSVQEILAGLEQGNFVFPAAWKDSDRLRSLSISLAKNTKAFHKLPNKMFGLLEWYPDAPKRPSPQEADDGAAFTPTRMTPPDVEPDKDIEAPKSRAS